MDPIHLTMACELYDRTLGLWDGRVTPKGIRLNYLELRPPETFRRMLKKDEFDIAEMSLSAYILGVGRGEERFVGIPVFLSRSFRHSFVFVNASSGIEAPKDLVGARVGVPEYHMTAALFIRGFLQDDYGVAPSDVKWYQGGQDSAGRKERVRLHLPDSISLEVVEDRSLDEMLVAGDLDALVTAWLPKSFRAGSPSVRRLFPDAAEVELDWYRRTGVFPIMHLVVIRRDVVERHPWVVTSLQEAFQESKDALYATFDGRGASLSILPQFQLHLEMAMGALGEDFYPYGIEDNTTTLEAALRYSVEQGLSPRLLTLEDLFPTSFDGEG